MKIIVKTNHPEHYKVLKQYVEPLEKILLGLKKEYRLKLPKSITLRHLRQSNRKDWKALTFARAGYSPSTGYFIALNMRIPNLKGLHIKTLAHEAAHIAEALKTKRWTHGPLFYEMEEKANAYIEKGGRAYGTKRKNRKR